MQNIGLYMGGHRVYNKNIGNEVLPEAQASNRRNLNMGMKFSLSDETKTADLADDFCRICRGHQPFC